MKKMLFTIFVGLTITLTSCGQTDPNKNIDEGKVIDNVYTSQEIGWTIEIPKGWTVIDKEKTKESNEKGLKALEETIDGEIDYSGLKNLISFQKNQFNIFQSTSEPFELEHEGEWEENNAALKEIIYNNSLNSNPNFDKSLAVKLGGDEYGMKSYFLVILKTGLNTTADNELTSNSFRGHLDNINRLVEEGKLIVAGPLGKNKNNYRGIFILNNIKTIDDAKVILQTDPAIKNGILDYEIFTWYGSAALPEYLPFSDKIWKSKP